MADPARHELEAGRFSDSHTADTGMQNAAANCWSRESSHTWARNAINRGADPNLVLNVALQQDIYQSTNVYRASDAFRSSNTYQPEQQYITTAGGGLMCAPQPGCERPQTQPVPDAPQQRPDAPQPAPAPDCRQPQANLKDLHSSEDKFVMAGKEIQDALSALHKGDLKEGRQELKDAITQINGGMTDVRNGVGGDFDLSQLPESNPLRRIGSGRQAIRGGRDELYEALGKLDFNNPNLQSVIADVESAAQQVGGGSANIRKAVGLVETGAQDHRPTAERTSEATTNPATQPRVDWYANHGERQLPTTRPGMHGNENYPKQQPTLKNPEDLKVANTEMAQSMGSMSQAVGDIMRGDYDAAMRELKGSLQKMDSGTQDLKSAFDGVVPGQESWTSAQDRINKAIERLQQGKYEDCITTIGTALTDMRKGRSDVQQASQPHRSTVPRQ